MKVNAAGIDVSSYQSLIDWKKVKAAGIDFVIIRAGWGWTHLDPSFLRNIREALDAGLEVGAYWFIYGTTEAEIKKNAETFDKTISEFKGEISMKVWADWEYDSDNNYRKITGKDPNKTTRTSFVRLFLETLKVKGYDVGVYANPDYLKNKFNDLSEYPLWLAHYSKTMGNYPALIWQYSSKEHIDGIKGYVDMNTYLGTKTEQAPEPVKEVAKEEPKAAGKTYTVKSGDTLTKIANANKTTVDKLLALNPQIKNKNLIKVGQIINLGEPEKTDFTKYKVNVNPKTVLNIREKSTVASQRIGTLKSGEIIEIEKVNGMWGKLANREGYVYMAYLKKQ